jgi:hypothetical protein
MEEPITIAAFNEREPAEHIARRLRETGLPAQVFDESFEKKWQLWNPHPRAHMRVRVHLSEETRAEALLDEWQGFEPALAKAVKRPQCGSFLRREPRKSRLEMHQVRMDATDCASSGISFPAQSPRYHGCRPERPTRRRSLLQRLPACLLPDLVSWGSGNRVARFRSHDVSGVDPHSRLLDRRGDGCFLPIRPKSLLPDESSRVTFSSLIKSTPRQLSRSHPAPRIPLKRSPAR